MLLPSVAYGILKNEVLQGTALSESLELFYRRTPTDWSGIEKIIAYTVDELLRIASNHPRIDWFVIVAEGTIYRSQNRFIEVVDDFVQSMESDVLLSGHLIDKPGFYCGVHEQFMIVNMLLYRKLEKPLFGSKSHSAKKLAKYKAGPSLHDNYTPQFLERQEGTDEFKVFTGGWNLISRGLEAGYKIINVPETIRAEKMYMYPNDQTDEFLRNMEAIYQIDATENFTQNRVLMYLLLKKLGFNGNSNPHSMGSFAVRKQAVFAFNTEPIISDPEWIADNRGALQAVITPCAGFLDLAHLWQFGFSGETQIICYDQNPDSLIFKKYLYENFNGDLSELQDFINKFQLKYPEVLIADNNAQIGYESLMTDFRNPQNFLELWNEVKKLDKLYIQCNLFTQYKNILKQVKQPEKKTLFCISDIFTGTNELTYGTPQLRNIFKNFLKDLKENKNLILQGTDHKNSPIMDYAVYLNDKYEH